VAVPDGKDHGLSGLVFATGYLLSEFDLQIAFFGRGGLAVEDTCTALLEGRHLIYELTIDHGWIHIKGREWTPQHLNCSALSRTVPETGKPSASLSPSSRRTKFAMFREQRGRFKWGRSARTVC
jgi:hypothetical protein